MKIGKEELRNLRDELDTLIGGRVIPTVIAILIAIVIYVVLILKLGAMSEEDILALPMGARILRGCRKIRLIPETSGETGEDEGSEEDE